MRRITIPYFILTALAILECFFYIFDYQYLATDGAGWITPSDTVTVRYIQPNGPADRAGLLVGDKILSVNDVRACWTYSGFTLFHDFQPDEIVNYKIIRNEQRLTIPVKLVSVWSIANIFFPIFYSVAFFIIAIGIFILFKRPGDPSAKVFFFFTQVFGILINTYLIDGGPLGIIRGSIMTLTFPFIGTLFLHFTLIFPERVKLIDRRRWFLPSLYILSAMIGIGITAQFIILHYVWTNSASIVYFGYLRFGHGWLSLTLLSSMIILISRYIITKEVIAKNQLRWIMFGFVLGLLPEAYFAIYPFKSMDVVTYNPMALLAPESVSALIFIVGITFAILRYRIWKIEVVVKQSLLYGTLTLLVAGLYFAIVYLVELTGSEHFVLVHFVGIIGASIIFIPLRSILQKRIDRLFHREPYNSTEVIAVFENITVGIYNEEELHNIIFNFLNSIFHFTSFTCMKYMRDGSFKSSHHMGHSEGIQTITIIPTVELNRKLAEGKPVAVKELKDGIPGLNQQDAEIVLPRIFQNVIGGLFICGRKRSGRTYSQEDIRLLAILTQRAAAFFHTADLYNNELNRQLALERERARISKDLHDDLGASLTRITMFSEAASQELARTDIPRAKDKVGGYLEEISDHSRHIVDQLSDVIWSLNPKNVSFDEFGLRIKNYLGRLHLLQDIDYEVNISDELSSLELSMDVKRNVYLIFKETLNNILKHAKANKISISIQKEDESLQMIIKDNGSGFDLNNQFNGNGLRNIQQRASDIGGKVDIQSKTGEGTIMFLNVKIP